MSQEGTSIWWTCTNCGHQQEINEGEEFSDITDEDCTFCIDGAYGPAEVFKAEKKVGGWTE